MRIKAIISYNGASYYGFQTQNREDMNSIQDEIEKVLSKIFNRKIDIAASGRTDRGVHALGQVIHFDVDEESVDLYKLRYSINCMLPKDISFKEMKVVNDEFHSRFSAKSKTYRYIINTNERNVILDKLVYNFSRKLDIDKIKEGMNLFLGEHSFISFCTNNEGDYIRNIYSFTLEEKEGYLIFDITGNGFRRYMVRMIIGTLIEIGLGNVSLEEIKEIIETKENRRVRYKAPSEGLYLVNVNYGGEEDDQN